MVQVSKIRFEGVRSVPEDDLRNALATRQSSWIPWGRKRYFDRAQLDADLRRVRAFYADQGYPDARVTGFDVQLNDEQNQVDVTLTIDEGEPVRIAAIGFYGFWEVPEEEMERIRTGLPFKVGDVRNRRMMVATERAVETFLHDHGFAYSRAWITEEETAPRALAISITADSGPLVHFGLIEINGNETVGRDVIERELTFKSGDVFSRRALQDTQRRLVRPRAVSVCDCLHGRFRSSVPGGHDPRDRGRREAPARQFWYRVRHRGKRPRRRRVSSREFPGRGEVCVGARPVFERSIAASERTSRSPPFYSVVTISTWNGSTGRPLRPPITRS